MIHWDAGSLARWLASFNAGGNTMGLVAEEHLKPLPV